jgi:hypothetical protein
MAKEAPNLFKRIDKSKTIRGLGRKRKEFEPKFGLRAKRVVDLRDALEVRLLRTFDGDEKLVKRIIALMERYPAGSIPEFICYTWLEKERIKFTYQAMLFGGRRQSGGLLPDFVVDVGGGLSVAWQVQGEYWHSLARKGSYDRSVSLRLQGAYFRGRRIWKVAELWEADLLDKYQRETVLRLALQGISVRQA